jgi:Transcription termination factor nusG
MTDDKQLAWLLLHSFVGQEPLGAEELWQTCQRLKRKSAVRSIAVLPQIPGHLLVRAETDAWSVIRHAKRITGFAGESNELTPLDAFSAP